MESTVLTNAQVKAHLKQAKGDGLLLPILLSNDELREALWPWHKHPSGTIWLATSPCRLAIEAQLRKVVEWAYEDCWEHPHKIIPTRRFKCDYCMEILRREAGLEGRNGKHSIDRCPGQGGAHQT